jgi:putative nucleotidyltransferase with HDIG domain
MGETILFVVPVAAIALYFGVRRLRTLEAQVRQHYDAALEAQRKAQRQLLRSARSLEHKVAERTYELDDARAETLRLLAVAAEYRDDGTFEHTERVGTLAAEIAAHMGMRAQQVMRLREAAPLHDVGKIATPDHILLKRGKLTPQEREVMQGHAALGARLLFQSSSPVLQMAAVIAASHHEWWDGSGYPRGLAGERIPLVGRVVAVADVFDALTHERPYKPAWPVERAIASIERAAGSQFDPRVVQSLLAVYRQVRAGAHEPAVAGRAQVPDGREPAVVERARVSAGREPAIVERAQAQDGRELVVGVGAHVSGAHEPAAVASPLPDRSTTPADAATPIPTRTLIPAAVAGIERAQLRPISP